MRMSSQRLRLALVAATRVPLALPVLRRATLGRLGLDDLLAPLGLMPALVKQVLADRKDLPARLARRGSQVLLVIRARKAPLARPARTRA